MTTSGGRRRLLLGYGASLAAALAYGGTTLVGRKMVTEYASPLVATSFSLLIGTVILGIAFQGQVRSDIVRAPHKGWILMTLAGVTAMWGVTFQFFALTHGPVVLVAPIAGISPLVTILLTYLFLSHVEKVTMRTVGGAMLVVGGVALIAVGGT